MTFRVPEAARVRTGRCASSPTDGCNGMFEFRGPDPARRLLRVIASDGCGWEHVSISLPDRCPTWEEMCCVRDVFWTPDVAVMQLHPPRRDYVNNHPYCLHLWRPVGLVIPLPPALMVGIPGLELGTAR